MDANTHIFNSEFALRQFNGSCPLLIKILNKFVLEYLNFNEKFTELMLQGDTDTIQRDIHTLKGISGNLGMEALHHASKEFEPKLTVNLEEQLIVEYLELLSTTLTTITDFISNNSNNSDTKPAIESDSKQVLITALKRNEFISEVKMQKFMQKLDLAPDVKNALKNSIDDFDYARALQLLQ
ncbi:Hpt domain-containing protein [uncultured Paraglaciecola sp.]|uniref:Hpt domain-containing protein n=1 Tax=uncultured Paraglaciecola sp. TaxID=1765024 RepID=UPI002598D03A|nr:Hpt domain-containing protein [uncultured Paraglaciecola sp.]